MSDLDIQKPKWYSKHIKKVKVFPLAIAITVFVLLLIIPTTNQTSASNCMAILGLVAIMWGTEAIPVVATAMLVPIPVVILGVLNDPTTGKQYESTEAAALISQQFFDPVVILFLGGFTIATAMDRYHISSRIAEWTLNKAGSSPKRILFAIMFLSMFLSMWISNVAASVICVSAVIPLVKYQLNRDDPFIKALLLGIAYSGNIGGMTTPIASPQNSIALHAMARANPDKVVTFVQWLLVSIPLCLCLLVVCWLWLLYMYPPAAKSITISSNKETFIQPSHTFNENDGYQSLESSRGRVVSTDMTGINTTENIRGNSDWLLSTSFHPEDEDLVNRRNSSATSLADFNGDEKLLSQSSPTELGKDGRPLVFTWNSETKFILGITILTVLLWCTEPLHIQWTGSIGIIAIIPVVAFFGSGVLTSKDFDSLTWSVLILMGGGLALGFAIQSSNLLEVAATSLGDIVEHSHIWVVLVAFSAMMSIIANFISSTVAAVIVLPIMATIGTTHHHMRMLTTLAAIMCSGAMGLPVSSFPNANSFSVTDVNRTPFAPTSDYLKSGVPMTFFSVLATVSIGFGITSALGF